MARPKPKDTLRRRLSRNGWSLDYYPLSGTWHVWAGPLGHFAVRRKQQSSSF